MPASRSNALGGVADEITHPELFENFRKRGREIRRRLDSEEPSAGHLTQISRKARSSLADLDAVDNHVAAARCIKNSIGSEPARGVDPIAEHNQKRAPGIGLAEQHARMRRVDQRRHALALRLIERCAHAIEVVGQPLTWRDDVTERNDRGPVTRFQPLEFALPRCLQMTESKTLQT